MASAIIVVTWEDEEAAGKALKTFKSWLKDKLIELGDAVVLVKDEEGKIHVKETEEFTPRRGAISGGVAGFIVGTLVGGPIGGALLGAAAGAYAGKKIDVGISNDEIEAVSDSMHSASSAICVQVKSIKQREMLAAAIRESGGKLHEISLTDDIELDMEETMARGSIR